MGFTLPINFNTPYKAASITDFWRRWHISLSSWLRDYLYISLGGNRKGKLWTYANLLITMLLGGLWHGPNWKFVFWGAMHGAMLAIEKLLASIFKFRKTRFTHFIGIFWTFHFVCFCWIFFRAESFAMAWEMLGQIFTNFHSEVITQIINGFDDEKIRQLYYVFGLIVLGFILHFLPKKWDLKWESFFMKTPLVLKSFYLAVIIWIVIQTASKDVVPFIYFQF
jgi:D-alanyl-lipoteichoic acid acyltransferase DltB (MBOAT superfamily)